MNISTIGVIGTGVMGSQIAQVVATAGYQVKMFDVNDGQLESAMHRIENGRFRLRGAVQRSKLSEHQLQETLGRIEAVNDMGGACRNADMIIEAMPEDIKLKIRVFRQLDELCPEHTILTSNTAGLSVAALAAATDRPGKVLGWHWFQPCVVMKLAELIIHDEVSQDALDAVTTTVEQCGKNVVVVRDQQMAWGFIGNRINRAVRVEAARVVAEGLATEEQVDAIMRDGFRWPMGPFEMQRGALS